MHIEFGVLGELCASMDGKEVDLGPARQQSVLAALLADANHTVSLDQLADRVWGQDPPEHMAATVRSYLSRLRAALPTEDWAIESRSGGYVVRVEEMAVDLYRFRRLLGRARAVTDEEDQVLLFQQALGLWRGEVFANLDSTWLNQFRNALRAEHFAAVLDYHDIQLRRGEHILLLPGLLALITDHPLDERLAGQLILALYRVGRQAEAYSHYENIRRRLADELGVDPSPRLRQLYQNMLAGEPFDDWMPQPRKARIDTIDSVIPQQLPANIRRFVGRQSELRQLNNLLAGRRQAEVIVISGSAGVGKTSLVVHWAHAIRDEFPDGQIYLDLRAFAASSPTRVRGLLQTLGVPSWRIPTELDAQIGLYRSLLATKKVLTVLDDASDSAPIRSLLAGAPGSLTVVTSRNRLIDLVATTDAHLLLLEPFTRDEAWQMLNHRLGADRVAAESVAAGKLVEWCAGLPQGLAAVTACALAYPHLRLADLTNRLNRSGPELTPATRSLRTSA
ncbi:BTAD domain-containing putative transcriptional regulator [Nonomuraea sp. NPDC050790]|uniref:AfsR/SARP family transcriptional regulator n=1 Tax=Nonomuraea sp. NPDC050790 TaxID=3364371 RepID=UPI0037AF0E37